MLSVNLFPGILGQLSRASGSSLIEDDHSPRFEPRAYIPLLPWPIMIVETMGTGVAGRGGTEVRTDQPVIG